MPLLDQIRGLLGQRTLNDLDLLSKERQDFLNQAADLGTTRLNHYETYADYYDGDQRTQLLDRAREYLEASGFKFAENFCETVVDVHADRLCVEKFEVVDNQAATDWLNDQWWARNRMDETQGVVHTETLKLGDGCLISDFDAHTGLPRARWNTPARVKFVYDDDGELLYVPKVWKTSEKGPANPQGRTVRRMNIWFPDRIEKWFSISESDSGDWAPWVDDDDIQVTPDGATVFREDDPSLPALQWPVWWTDNGTEDGEPLGIPVTHFRHKPKGRRYGRSLLRNVVPQQDQLNKQILDLFYVMDSQGWKQRWAAGVPDDVTIAVAIGEWVKSSSHEARFGEFTAEDPRPMVETIDATLMRLSARSRTPLHDLIKGEPPSGEALKTAEGGIVKASEDCQTTFGNSWEDNARINWRIGSVFGDAPPFDPDAVIIAHWDSPETRNEKLEAEVHEAELRMKIVSRQTISERRGYDWEQEKDRLDEEAKAGAEALADAFNRGAGGGPPVPPFGGAREE